MPEQIILTSSLEDSSLKLNGIVSLTATLSFKKLDSSLLKQYANMVTQYVR